MKKRMLLLSMCLMLAVIPGCGKSGKQQEASVKASQSDAKEQKSQDMKGSEERASSKEIPANQNLLTGVLDLTEVRSGNVQWQSWSITWIRRAAVWGRKGRYYF